MIFLILTGGSLLPPAFKYTFEVLQEKGEFEAREDLMGRSEYLELLTQDPQTKKIPDGIRQAELAFAADHQLATASFRNQQLDINSIGPINVGGRTRAVAFDTRDSNVILAGGVSGSVWKSTDAGATWRKTSHPENRNSVTCIVQDIRPGMEDVWYHGTGEIVGNSARGGGAPFRGDGIYKSTDNGESWIPLPSTQLTNPATFSSQFQYVWKLEVNPNNLIQDEVLAAVFGGVIRSVDGGGSWEAVLGQDLTNLPDTTDLNRSNAAFYTDLHRSANNVFYATLSTVSASGQRSPDAGFYISTNGMDWLDITPLTEESGYRRAVVSSSASDPDLSYFLIDSSPILLLEHRISSLNDPAKVFGFDPEPRMIPEFEGESASFNTQNSYNLMVRIHPEDPDLVFLGATNLYRSKDAFRTQENTTWIGGYDSDGTFAVYPNHHPDQHDLIFFPNDPDIAISASDGGLILSNDIAADSVFWSSRSIGYITSQFFTVALSQQEGDLSVLGGMQDNGTDLSSNGDMNWKGVLGGDGAFAETVRDDAFYLSSFQRGQTLLITLNEEKELSSFARVDPGSLVEAAGSGYLFINPFAVDPNNANRVFFAGGNHLYFHPNISQIPGGSQVPNPTGWKKVNEVPLDNEQISAVEISANGNVVYFGSAAGSLLKLSSADNVADFQVDEITSSSFPEGAFVSCIAVNPENPDHLLVIFSNYQVPSIFESRDGGSSFQDVSGNLEQTPDGSGNGPSIRWAEIIPTQTGLLFLVGTSVGLYSTSQLTGLSTLWIKESMEVLGSSVIPMMDYRPSDGRLAIATHGNGMFATNIADFKRLTFSGQAADRFEVGPVYPNPFQDDVAIQYELPNKGTVRIDIYTASGKLVKNLLLAKQFAGKNEVIWDGTNTAGTTVPNGIYFFTVRFQNTQRSGRLIFSR